MSKEVISCDHTVEESSRTRTLKLNCKRCEKEYSLEKCLPNILLSLENEYDIDSLMISDHMEKQYIGPGIDILTQIRDMSQEIESFSSRTQNKKKCPNCKLKPSSLYPRFKKRFIKDPGGIYEEIEKVASEGERKQGCPKCIDSLREELEILGMSALKLRSKVLKEGFDIIG